MSAEHVGRIGRALAAGDIETVEAIVRESLGIDNPMVQVRKWCATAAMAFSTNKSILTRDGGFVAGGYYQGDPGWSDSTWMMWFRNRAEAAGLLASLALGSPNDGRLTVLLHVFFLCRRNRGAVAQAAQREAERSQAAQYVACFFNERHSAADRPGCCESVWNQNRGAREHLTHAHKENA